MKKYLLSLFLMFFVQVNSQELSISETLDYINSNLKFGRKFELLENGKLKFIESKKDYQFDYHSIEESRKIEESKKYNILIFRTQEISIYDFKLYNKGFVEFGNGDGEFKLEFYCNKDKSGCSESKVFDKNGSLIKYNHFSVLDFKNYDRETNDKLFNAINYLISLAKNDIRYQKNSNDPFLNENFNIKANNKEIIKLINESGVFKINVNLGTINKNFILDTGASEISISQTLEKELISKGFVNKEDYVEQGLYRIADGSIISCRRLKIKELKIGEIIINDLTASIGTTDSPLLLGKNFLDKFKLWTIDNNNQTLLLEK